MYLTHESKDLVRFQMIFEKWKKEFTILSFKVNPNVALEYKANHSTMDKALYCSLASCEEYYNEGDHYNIKRNLASVAHHIEDLSQGKFVNIDFSYSNNNKQTLYAPPSKTEKIADGVGNTFGVIGDIFSTIILLLPGVAGIACGVFCYLNYDIQLMRLMGVHNHIVLLVILCVIGGLNGARYWLKIDIESAGSLSFIWAAFKAFMIPLILCAQAVSNLSMAIIMFLAYIAAHFIILS